MLRRATVHKLAFNAIRAAVATVGVAIVGGLYFSTQFGNRDFRLSLYYNYPKVLDFCYNIDEKTYGKPKELKVGEYPNLKLKDQYYWKCEGKI